MRRNSRLCIGNSVFTDKTMDFGSLSDEIDQEIGSGGKENRKAIRFATATV